MIITNWDPMEILAAMHAPCHFRVVTPLIKFERLEIIADGRKIGEFAGNSPLGNSALIMIGHTQSPFEMIKAEGIAEGEG